MTQKERMLAGLPYKAWMDGLPEERARAQRACWEFNRLPPDARAERTALLRGLFGRTGEHLHIEEPFHCDLGYNIEVGEWFYANYNCVILDVCRVTIGDNVMFAAIRYTRPRAIRATSTASPSPSGITSGWAAIQWSRPA